MPRMSLPNVTPRVFCTISGLVVAGLLLSACAVFSLVPAAELEAERQQRQALQVKQQQLLEELRKQSAAKGELEEQLAAEGLKRQALEQRQEQLERDLKQQSAVRQALDDGVAKLHLLLEKEAHLARLTEQLEEVILKAGGMFPERQALEQRQEQLERDLRQQSALNEELEDDNAKLHLLLPEKEAHITRLTEQLEEAILKAGGMVPAAELEAERQQRQALQVKQQQLLEELRNQTAAKGELEEQLAAEGLKRQALEQRQEQLERDLKQQSAVRQALDDGVAKLHLLLLEKEARIKGLTEQLEKVILEVVRVKAKLRSLESKAEAASNLAEAEIAVKSLKAKGKRWNSDPSFIKAEQLTKLSAREFKKGNYGGALYLTSQAKSLIKGARGRSMNREMTSRVAGEVPFVLPLPLQLLSKSNVREGPGLHFKVLYSLAKGTALIGHAYKGQWVRVKSEDGRGGWVFYKLVGAD